MESDFDFLRREIRGSNEAISTQIDTLMQSMSRALEQLDTIRLVLLAESISPQAPGLLALLLVPVLLPMAEADMVEDVPVALILRLLIISLTLLILMPLAMIFIRSSIVSLLCLGSNLWPLYLLAD